MLVAVTDHAAERYRQRVRGTLDAQGRDHRARGARVGGGRVSREPPPGAAAQRGSVYVRDGDVVFVCLEDRPRGELVVVTLWEEGEDAAVPRRFTDVLKRDERAGACPTEPGALHLAMGFLDKAKKMAEQAQAKLDEAQKQFNDGQGGSGAPATSGRRVRQARPPDPAAAARHRDAAAGRPARRGLRAAAGVPAATPGVPPTGQGDPLGAAAAAPAPPPPAAEPPVAQPGVPPTASAPSPRAPGAADAVGRPDPRGRRGRAPGPPACPRTATRRTTSRRSSRAATRSRARTPLVPSASARRPGRIRWAACETVRHAPVRRTAHGHGHPVPCGRPRQRGRVRGHGQAPARARVPRAGRGGHDRRGRDADRRRAGPPGRARPARRAATAIVAGAGSNDTATPSGSPSG